MSRIIILLRQKDCDKISKVYTYISYTCKRKNSWNTKEYWEQLQGNCSNTKKYSVGVLLFKFLEKSFGVIRVKSDFQCNDVAFSQTKIGMIAREKFDALNGIPNASIFRTFTRRIRNVKYHFPPIYSSILECRVFTKYYKNV